MSAFDLYVDCKVHIVTTKAFTKRFYKISAVNSITANQIVNRLNRTGFRATISTSGRNFFITVSKGKT